MKNYFAVVFIFLYSCVYSQITDTCEYVSQSYDLGGLDCAWGVLYSDFTIDSYQWVNCDANYTPFVNDTSEFYQSSYDGNVAVIIEAFGCTDTSYCHDICVWGIEEISLSHKELISIVDITGKETDDKPNTILIYMYSDGTTEKVIRVE